MARICIVQDDSGNLYVFSNEPGLQIELRGTLGNGGAEPVTATDDLDQVQEEIGRSNYPYVNYHEIVDEDET